MKRLFYFVALLPLFLFLVANQALADDPFPTQTVVTPIVSPAIPITLSPNPTIAPTSFPVEGSVNSVFCGGERRNGVQTAIGCINVDGPENIIGTVISIATGVGGGIALLLILYGVFIVTTSAGNPDKLKSGSEIITSAIVGLVFILLSVFLVNLIGIKILAIPGLE